MTLPYIPEFSECATCGQCLAHCPTYAQQREEKQSPRGRLRLIERMLVQQQTLPLAEQQALFDCLQCRACERVCPSQVAYGTLIDKAVTQLQNQSKLVRLLLKPYWLKRSTLTGLAYVISAWQRLGLQKLIQRTQILPEPLRRISNLLPHQISAVRWQPYYPATHHTRGSVALFLGCIASVFDYETRLAAIKILNRLGYDVHIPSAQQCCGALHLHNGQPQLAQQFAADNLAVFNVEQYQAVLYCDSACGVMLHEYQHNDMLDSQARQTFQKKLQDLSSFLLAQDWQHITLAPLEQTVAVHDPCSSRFPLKNNELIYKLLDYIPNIKLIPLQDNHMCCGAGGVHMLTTPDIAEPLRHAKVAAIHESNAALVVSSNISCLMHIGAGTQRTKVLHAISLLGQQLRT